MAETITYNEHGRKQIPALKALMTEWIKKPQLVAQKPGIKKMAAFVVATEILEAEYNALFKVSIDQKKKIEYNDRVLTELYALVEKDSPDMAAFVKGKIGDAMLNVKATLT
jgi:hypothetical protein